MRRSDSTSPGDRSGHALEARAKRVTRPGHLAALVLGFSTILVQTMVLRELMVAWLGDETSFGIALAAWLLSAGLGSAVGGRLFAADRAPRTRLAAVLAGLALLSPLSLLAARAGRTILGAHAGEVAGLGQLVVAAVLAVAPFALGAGAAFSLTIRVLTGHNADTGTAAPARRDAVARVYALEAAGAVCSGVLLSFVLIPHLSPATIVGLCALLLTIAALRFAPRAAPARLTLILSGLTAVALLSPLGDTLDASTVRAQWSELGPVLSRDSVHGRVVATRRDGQMSIYESGVLTGSSPDRLAAEEAVHIPMLQHPAPERVLLVGGGLGGSIAETLKHPSVKRVDYVELDPALLAAAREAFRDSLLAGLADERVRTHHGDARLYIRTTRDRYDVIILNVPDPTTTQLNRFYTVEFFEETRRVLATDGVIALTVSGSANYISPELAELTLCLIESLRTVFPRVALLPGDPSHLVATAAAAPLVRSGAQLASEIERRGVDARFIARHYLEDRFSAARLEAADAAIGRATAKGLNRDLSPSGYLAGLVVRARLRGATGGLLHTARRAVNLTTLAALAGLLAIASGAVPRLLALRSSPMRTPEAQRASFARAAVLSVVVVGFSEMTLEMTAIVAYQSLYGYVYGHLALITAAFMLGLALGGWLGTRLASLPALNRGYILLQCGLTAVPVGFGVAVARLGSAASTGLGGAAISPGLVTASALPAGVQFPLAAAILRARGGSSETRQGGALYAADLFGAALGAIAASVVLLPVLGTVGTMTGLAVLNASVLVALACTTPSR